MRATPTVQKGAGSLVRYPGPHARTPERPTAEGVDLLVRFGIDSHFGRVVTRMLIWFMMWQPVYVAFGVELEDGEVTPTVMQEETVVETLVEYASAPMVNADDMSSTESSQDVREDDEEQFEEFSASSTDEVEASAPETSPTPTEQEPVDIDDDVMEDPAAHDDPTDSVAEELEGAATPEVPSSETGSSSGSSGSTSPPASDGAEDILSDDGMVTDDEADEERDATSSTDLVHGEENINETEESIETDEVPDIINVAQNPTSKYTFGEGDCTLVADGEFYCIATGAERVRPGDPRVYAERDREGDREIFYFDGVEVKRITNNNYDDFAPSFDERALRIVWQAMLNDRLQVMYHDIRTETTRQITTSRQNSSNPHIRGDIIVWQEWVDNNWEIMMTNVRGGGDLEIQRLTDNVMHDMFPQVYDGLITWQREKGRSWEVIVYDLQTGKEMAVEKNSDARYENPRFVLLFDSKHDNGDVQTIGYDLNTGEMMQLGTRSRPEPSQAPITPDSETPDALAREAAGSSQLKVGRDGNDADDDVDMEL